MGVTRKQFKNAFNEDQLRLLITMVGDLIQFRDWNVKCSKDKWPLRVEAKKVYCKLYNLLTK